MGPDEKEKTTELPQVTYADNTTKLAAYYRTRSKKLRNEIVMDNQELVWFIVKRYTSGIATREDLFQAGILGLMIAIDRFDPSRGVQLSTYAVPYIKNEIRCLIDNPDYLEDHAGLEAVDDYEPRTLQEKLASLYEAILTPDERTILDLLLRTNDEPAWSVNDISKHTKVSSKRIRELYASGLVKINQPWVCWYIKKLKNTLQEGLKCLF